MKTTILALILMASSLGAFPASFKWNPNPVDEGVTEYRLYQIVDGQRVLKLTVPASPTPKIEVEAGQQFVVTAFNGFESEQSDPVTVPKIPSKPGGLQVVEIQVSLNLTEWETIAFVPLKSEHKAKFVRTKLTEIQPTVLAQK